MYISELNNSTKSKYNMLDLINGKTTLEFKNKLVFELNSFGVLCLSQVSTTL